MPFRLTVNGVLIECDSPIEASGLIEVVASIGKPRAAVCDAAIPVKAPQAAAVPIVKQQPPITVGGTAQEPDFKGFWERLAPKAKVLAMVLREAGEKKMETPELAEKMHCDPLKIKYAIRGVTSAAKMFNIKPEDIVVRDTGYRNRKAVSTYWMPEKARMALAGME